MVRKRRCEDCVVGVVLGAPPSSIEPVGVEPVGPAGAEVVPVAVDAAWLDASGVAPPEFGEVGFELDEADRKALRVLAESGLWSPDHPPWLAEPETPHRGGVSAAR
ncbi:hypothetical protein [Actinopolymorpha cephalotaxi]|uniref:Uncharacterized protein n=1 Tax=Actinopolymorpha cephalotaxi TaxID=504797 RepID=A0ABX2S2G5_9ACTN|nr:hypothetical protein [Actinopolymorpha cephalotaxi]NYH82605.1 hypothetical protein [Actinopolymorpha cephalotaxi]